MTDGVRALMTGPETAVSPLAFDWGLQFQQIPTAQSYEYWRFRCEGRLMPRRRDLDPVAMRKFTQHVGLIELRASADQKVEYFIRRAGSKWEEVYGPITGHYLSEFLPPHIEQTWRTVFDAVCNKKAPTRVTTKVDFEEKSWINIELFVAPLGESDEPTMLLLTFVGWSDR